MDRRKFLKITSTQLAATSLASLPFVKAAAAELDVLLQNGGLTANSLQFIREEEKLARDVYITLYNEWGLNIFKNISGSEQIHTDKVKMLLNKYNVEDPAENTIIGEFVNPKISHYYEQLVDRGFSSRLEALHVGAYVEELDILDLRHEIDNATSNDVKQVYTNLMLGSYNHLQAFVGQIQRQVPYSAQLMDPMEVDKILNANSSTTNASPSRRRRGRR